MKPVLFVDFNGVISYNKFWNSIYSPGHHLFFFSQKINDFVFVENADFVKDWMIGRHSSEDVHEIINKEFGIDKKYLFKIFEKDSRELDISEVIMAKLSELKSKFRLALITDNMDSFSRFTLPNNPILSKVFDGIFISSNTGKLKKTDNGRIFNDIAQIFDSKIEDCILIDDSKSNCNLFESLGGKSICITGENKVLERLSSLDI